jgi:hypothetical protein
MVMLFIPNLFIDEAAHIISKTYITRVEGENTRLRDYKGAVT